MNPEISRSEESLWCLVYITSRGVDLTLRELDLTKIIFLTSDCSEYPKHLTHKILKFQFSDVSSDLMWVEAHTA